MNGKHEAPEIIAELGFEGSDSFFTIRSISFSPNQAIVCSGGSGKDDVIIHSLPTLHEEKTMKGHTETIRETDFSPDGRLIVSVSIDKTIRLWNVENGNSSVMKGHSFGVWCVRFSQHNGNHFVTGSADKSLKLWDVETLKEIMSFEENKNWIVSVDIENSKGQLVVSGDENSEVKLYDLRSKKSVRTIAHPSRVFSVRFHPNKPIFASGTVMKRIKLFDFRTFKVLHDFGEIHKHAVRSLCFDPFGKYLASGSYDKYFKIFDFEDEEKKNLFSLKGKNSSIYCVRFSPDAELFASSSSGDKKLTLWSFPPGKYIRKMGAIEKMDLDERVQFLREEGTTSVYTNLNEEQSNNFLEVRICALGDGGSLFKIVFDSYKVFFYSL